MSRTASSIGEIPLQPAARPLDQFSAPEVRQSLQGRSLLQLGRALEDVTPGITQVLDHVAQAHVTAQQQLAEQNAPQIEQMLRQNKLNLKQAADQGLIQHSDNPYYIEHLQQQVDEIRVRKQTESAWNEYLQSPLRYDTNATPEDVDKFLSDRLNPLLAQANPVEAQTLSPMIESAKEAIIRNHISTTSQVRQQEMQATFSTNFRQATRHVDNATLTLAEHGDLSAQAKVQQMQDALQKQVNDLGQVLPWPVVNGLAVEAAHDEAVSRRSSAVFRAALQGISTPGGTLENYGDAPALADKLPHEILNLQNEDANAEQVQKRMQAHAATMNIIGSMNQELADLIKVNPHASYGDVMLSPDEIAKLAPEASQELIQTVSSMAAAAHNTHDLAKEEQADALLEQITPSAISGKLDQRGVSALKMLAALGAVDKVEAVERLQATSRANVDRVTDPAFRTEFYKRLQNRNLDLNFVLSANDNGQVASQELNSFVNIAVGQNENSHRDAALMSKDIATRFRDKWFKINGAPSPGSIGDEDREKISTGMEAAQSDFLLRATQMIEDNPGLPPSDMRKKLEDLSVEIEKKHAPQAPELSTAEAVNKSRQVNEPSLPLFTHPVVKSVMGNLKTTSGDLVEVQKAINYQQDPSQYRSLSGHPSEDSLLKFNTGALDRLKELHSQSAFGHMLGQFGQAADENAFALYPANYKSLDADRQDALNTAQKTLQTLQAKVPQADQMIQETLAAIRANGGKPTGEQQIKLRDAGNILATAVTYRDALPFTVAEAKKAAGDDAWTQLPLFFDERDLQNNGEKIAKSFGIAQESYADFIDYQRRLLPQK